VSLATVERLAFIVGGEEEMAENKEVIAHS